MNNEKQGEMLKGIKRVLFPVRSDTESGRESESKPTMGINRDTNGYTSHETQIVVKHTDGNDKKKKTTITTNDSGPKKMMRSERAGLCFSVGRMESHMRTVAKGGFRISGEAPVALAAVIEKALSDVMALAVEECTRTKRHRITANHVHHAIQSSTGEYKKLFRHLNFANISIDSERERSDRPELPVPKSERSQIRRRKKTSGGTAIKRSALSIKPKSIQKKKKKKRRTEVPNVPESDNDDEMQVEDESDGSEVSPRPNFVVDDEDQEEEEDNHKSSPSSGRSDSDVDVEENVVMDLNDNIDEEEYDDDDEDEEEEEEGEYNDDEDDEFV